MEGVSISVILGVLAAKLLILLFLFRLVLKSYRSLSAPGQPKMIGWKGKAVTEVAPEGRVIVGGEYWWAHSSGRIAAGESVRVTGIEGLTLEIEPCPDRAVIPRSVSAVELFETEGS